MVIMYGNHGIVGTEVIGIGVGAVVFNQSNHVLLLHRKFDAVDVWTIPGGEIAFGEHPAQAVARELSEETGLRLCVARFLGFVDLRLVGQQWISLAFRIDQYANEPHLSANEPFDNVGWFPWGDLPNLDLIARETLSRLNWQGEWTDHTFRTGHNLS